MDHETALKLEAADRYCQGALSTEERDAFEEHFFDCAECARSVRVERSFQANLHAALREPAPAHGGSIRPVFRLAFAASLFMNLLLIGLAGYQSLRLVPGLRKSLSEAAAPHLDTVVTVPTTVRSERQSVRVSRDAVIASLSFALPRPYSHYRYEITQALGPVLVARTVPPPPAIADEILLTLPLNSLAPGTYLVTLSGVEGDGLVEIGRCQLEIVN